MFVTRCWYYIPAFVMTLLLLQTVAEADVVVLREDGRKLYGRVVSVSNTEVVLEEPDGTRLPLSRRAVFQIVFTENDQGGRPEGSPGSSPPTPVPPSPDEEVVDNELSPAPAATGEEATGRTVFLFPEADGSFNDNVFAILSKFRGNDTGGLYAGLYNFEDKGTFWIQLPRIQHIGSELHFSLYGKWSTGEPVEKFSLKARYLDSVGRQIGESPLVFFDYGQSPPRLVEWFDRLEDVAGLGGARSIIWQIPARTRTVEFRAFSAQPDEREHHLVGYLGNMRLVLPYRQSQDISDR